MRVTRVRQRSDRHPALSVRVGHMSFFNLASMCPPLAYLRRRPTSSHCTTVPLPTAKPSTALMKLSNAVGNGAPAVAEAQETRTPNPLVTSAGRWRPQRHIAPPAQPLPSTTPFTGIEITVLLRRHHQ